jgi:hypothetical protein
VALGVRFGARGLRVVSVGRHDGSPNEKALYEEVMNEEGVTHPSFLDRGHVWHRKAKIRGRYPIFIVVGHEGKVVHRQSGKLEEGAPKYEELAQVIEKALSAP